MKPCSFDISKTRLVLIEPPSPSPHHPLSLHLMLLLLLLLLVLLLLVLLLLLSHSPLPSSRTRGGWQHPSFQTLECQIVPSRSEHLRIAIQSGGGEGRGNVYVDAVELFHGGPTPAELAIASVVGFMDKPRSMPSKVSQ